MRGFNFFERPAEESILIMFFIGIGILILVMLLVYLSAHGIDLNMKFPGFG